MSQTTKIDVLITGVGGQGIILSSDIIAETAIASGYDVKKTDVHGMAQRGGAVTSHVRIAGTVASPLINEGNVDILLAFEKLEAARWAGYLRPGGIAIINNHSLPPLSVALGADRYPTDAEVINLLKQRIDEVYLVGGTGLALKLGDARTLNILMIGCVSAFTPFTDEAWKKAVSELVPPKVRDMNLTAFDRGKEEVHNARV
ncbi:MAG: indolepyruvate oxidoreductase subunit beta [Chloroflexota bacterium]